MQVSLDFLLVSLALAPGQEFHAAENLPGVIDLPGVADFGNLPPDVHHLVEEIIDVVDAAVIRWGSDNEQAAIVFFRCQLFLGESEQYRQAREDASRKQEYGAAVVEAVRQQSLVGIVQGFEAGIQPVGDCALVIVILQ